jgi:Zn-dependent protease
MELFGSVVFPLLCIFMLPGGFLFGWGKPVIPNPAYFENPRKGETLTALSGPLANLLVALVMAVIFGFAYRHDPQTEGLFAQILIVNVLLAVFNLLPLPPLDGGVLLKHAIRMSEENFLRISQWSFILWLVIISVPQIRAIITLAMLILSFPFQKLYLLISR